MRPALAFMLMVTGVATMFIAVACSERGGADNAAPAEMPPTPTVFAGVTVVAVGDSLTEGYGVKPEEAYPARLEGLLLEAGHNVQVVNAGNSGETSSGARARLNWVMGLDPDIVVLAAGGNDGLRGIDPALTAENLDAMVGELTAQEVTVILAGMEMVQNMGEEYTTAFRAIYPDVAARHKVILVPFLLDGVAADPALNQPDFIHPNAAGQEIMAQTLLPYVQQALDLER